MTLNTRRRHATATTLAAAVLFTPTLLGWQNAGQATVLREYRNEKGAAVMWASPTRSLGGPPSPPVDLVPDHTRASGGGRTMAHELTRVDEDLWNRMRALTEEQLSAALRPMLSNGEVRGVIRRRDRMQEIVDRLVEERGATYVFMRRRQD